MQALDIVKNQRPDLVLLDMKIPGMDGIEILKRMKIIDEGIRVIIMTAYGELDMIQLEKSSKYVANLNILIKGKEKNKTE
ncbi:response regulator [Bacillus licheniformis]|nr:response regulator [Bacillus licheniformis]